MNKRINQIVIFFIAVGMFMVIGILCYKLHKHEVTQDQQISNLLFQIDLLRKDYDDERSIWIENSNSGRGRLNVLVLGNSITRHGLCDYWWNEIGMAATTEENDYYHKVVAELENIYDDVNAYAYNFSQWEISDHDRGQTIQLIDDLLNPNVNLIIIQLGENISNTESLETDLEYLIAQIQGICSNAQIIMVGNFWQDDTVENIKERIAKKYSLKYIDLKDIWGKEEFQSAIGTVVYDEEGNSHIVQHAGVARHPGDEGMKYIATKILEKVKKYDSAE